MAGVPPHYGVNVGQYLNNVFPNRSIFVNHVDQHLHHNEAGAILQEPDSVIGKVTFFNMPLTLYAVSDGPPSLAVRMLLKSLNLDYTHVNVDFGAGEHMTDDYEKKNPQKEIPVLNDDGFYLGESNAILQYLVDQYGKDDKLYPKEPKDRAIVNHRLCFNLSTYYRNISEHVLAPMFFDYQRTPLSLKKTDMALKVFTTYLQRLGTKYAAGDNLTIADLQLVTATMCLEAINFDLSRYHLIEKWYATFKKEYPDLWSISEGGMKELSEFEKNPPDLSHMDHPIHPIRRVK